MSQVGRLEVLCKQLYESSDAGTRSEAEKALVSFQNNPNALVTCQVIMFINKY